MTSLLRARQHKGCSRLETTIRNTLQDSWSVEPGEGGGSVVLAGLSHTWRWRDHKAIAIHLRRIIAVSVVAECVAAASGCGSTRLCTPPCGLVRGWIRVYCKARIPFGNGAHFFRSGVNLFSGAVRNRFGWVHQGIFRGVMPSFDRHVHAMLGIFQLAGGVGVCERELDFLLLLLQVQPGILLLPSFLVDLWVVVTSLSRACQQNPSKQGAV